MNASKTSFIALLLLYSGGAYADDDEVSQSFYQQVSDTTSAIKGEIVKSVLAARSVAQSLLGQALETQLQAKVAQAREMAKPTDIVCGEMASQRALSKGFYNARAEVMASHRSDAARPPGFLAGSPSARPTMEAAHQRTNKLFCSTAEAKQGICTAATDPAFQRMAGADQDAMYLFQTADGGQTYEGRRGGAQAQAMDALIQRIAYGPAPIEPLPAGSTAMATPTGRVLSEMERRYNGFLSMAVYSLRQVKASKQPLN